MREIIWILKRRKQTNNKCNLDSFGSHWTSQAGQHGSICRDDIPWLTLFTLREILTSGYACFVYTHTVCEQIQDTGLPSVLEVLELLATQCHPSDPARIQEKTIKMEKRQVKVISRHAVICMFVHSFVTLTPVWIRNMTAESINWNSVLVNCCE